MDSTMLYLHVKKIGNESVDPVKNLDSSYPIKLCFKKQFWKYDIRLLATYCTNKQKTLYQTLIFLFKIELFGYCKQQEKGCYGIIH